MMKINTKNTSVRFSTNLEVRSQGSMLKYKTNSKLAKHRHTSFRPTHLPLKSLYLDALIECDSI